LANAVNICYVAFPHADPLNQSLNLHAIFTIAGTIEIYYSFEKVETKLDGTNFNLSYNFLILNSADFLNSNPNRVL